MILVYTRPFITRPTVSTVCLCEKALVLCPNDKTHRGNSFTTWW